MVPISRTFLLMGHHKIMEKISNIGISDIINKEFSQGDVAVSSPEQTGSNGHFVFVLMMISCSTWRIPSSTDTDSSRFYTLEQL